ncbi:MAG: lamin tail domain-containing protein [Bacteroidales bacterium]
MGFLRLWQPSPEQSFTVEGLVLGNISIDAPDNYEISEISGSGYTNTVFLVQLEGTVDPTTIYVRLKANLAVGNYDNEIIDITSTGAVDKSVVCNGTIFNVEPTNNPSGLTAYVNSYDKITVAWSDSGAEGYLIKGSNVSYGDIANPADGVPESDGALVHNVPTGIQSFQFTGLLPSTIYYFKNYAYNGSGASINYKVDVSVPQDEAQTTEPPAGPNVFFSEYIEGTGNNKAIEIYNGSGSTIDLSEFSVKLGANGGDWGNSLILSGSLAPGEVYVIYNPSAGPEIQAVGDVSSDVTYFNGDDALGLFFTNVLIDVIGNPFEDPGSSWDVAGVAGATVEHTINRKLTVSEGNTNWANSAGTNASNSEWVVQDQDYFNNLGFYGTAWTGTINYDWANSGNWDIGIPGSSCNVLIPDVGSASATFPIISGSAYLANLFMAAGSSLDIASSGDLSVNETFENNGTLTIHSDASGAGSLIESNGVIANVERYLSANTGPDSGPGWHYVSSPVTTANSAVFDGLYLMEWDEPAETWTEIINPGIPLNTNMYGYSVWAPTETTVNFSGPLNTGALSLSLTNVPGSPNPEDASGWNFVGNPYASGLDWDVDDGSGWTRSSTNVALSIYYWTGTQYASYVKNGPVPGPNGGTRYIAPHQGFFVKCLSVAGGLISVDNGARVHTSQAFWKSGKENEQLIRIGVTGNNFSDELIIDLNESSSPSFDVSFDAYKLLGALDAPQIYSKTIEGVNVSINSLPEITQTMSIPIAFKAGVEAIYEISVNELNGFDETPLYLEDLMKNLVVDIKSEVYSFSYSPDDISDRFLLHFFNPNTNGAIDTQSTDKIFVFVVNNTVKILSDKPISGEVKIYDMLGQEVISNQLSSSNDYEISMINKSGYFIVALVSDRNMINKKIYLNKK